MSRVLGLIRDALIAAFFGISFQSDAFFIAFRPFDLLRKTFSEGILNISFIPVFSKILVSDGKSKAVSFLFSFFCFLTFAGTLLMLIGIVFGPVIIKTIAPGFAALSYQAQLTTLLFKIMLPYLWFILMSSLCMGVLNSFENFAVPGFAPVAFNLVVIFFTIVVANFFNTPVIALALGVTIGGVIQLLIQIFYIIFSGTLKPSEFFNFKFRFNFDFHPGLIKILKIMIPSMIGASSYQVNIMTASFFASKLDAGSVSFLYYADRLMQFPLALFAVSSAMVLLPQFSKKAALRQMDEIADLFSSAVKLVFFITIPAMAGLMALDEQIVSMLFGYGAFNAYAISQTADCLFFLSLGLWTFTGSRLLVTLYYSLSNIKIPFYSGVFSIVLNLFFCLVFVDTLGLKGIVLAVLLSSFAGLFFLLINIPGIVNINKIQIIVSACRALFFSAIMYFLVQKMADFILLPGISKIWYGTGVIFSICFGIGFYFIINFLTSSPELNRLLRKG